LVEVALAYPDGTVSVKDVARRQSISAKYLEHIMAGLRAAGLVRAIRGMHGGYALARAPGHITLKELVEALEGPLAPVDCVDHPDSCPTEGVCPIRQTWVEMKESIEQVLNHTTVQDLVDRTGRKTTPTAAMYHI